MSSACHMTLMGNAKMQVPVTTLGVLCALITFAFVAGRPPAHRLPVWPDQFTLDILFRVEIYGPKWNSTGKIFYDWNHKVGLS